MARFAQYAMVAAEEALKDAEWAPTQEEDLEATASILQTIESSIANTFS